MSCDDLLRGRVQIPRPRVVAEPLPRMQNVRFSRSRKAMKIRKAAQPLLIIAEHSRDLGLLEHDFRDENRVRITRSAPGQISAVLPKPAQENTTERCGVESRSGADDEASNAK